MQVYILLNILSYCTGIILNKTNIVIKMKYFECDGNCRVSPASDVRNAWPGLALSQLQAKMLSRDIFFPNKVNSFTIVRQLYSSTAVTTHLLHAKHEAHVKPKQH